MSQNLENCECLQKCPEITVHHCASSENPAKDVSFAHKDEELKPLVEILSKPCDLSQPPIFEKTELSIESKNAPCYLPQPTDKLPSRDHLISKKELGPWAEGKVDWSPISGITGIRPIVDRYSIARYSPLEWRQHNNEVLTKIYETYESAKRNSHSGQLRKAFDVVDKSQVESNKRLRERAKVVEKWKYALERAIKSYIDEISIMEEQRTRLKQSLAILGMPRSIAIECIEKRAGRTDIEHVRDNAEEELIKEVSLVEEIRLVLSKTLRDVEQQQAENRAARQRLEYDWSDKRNAYKIELENIDLDNNSTTILFKPGVTKYSTNQSSDDYWERLTKETLEDCEKCRKRSIKLRSTANEILMNAARDLRLQAGAVEKAFFDRISCSQEVLTRLENELMECLKTLVATETRIELIKKNVQNLDQPMKVAQSRLGNRQKRENVENCRDYVLQGLVEEVNLLQEALAAVLASMNEAERVKEELINTRVSLEKEIALKRRTIMIDRDRCMLIRSHFPSAAALSGFTM